MESMTEVKKKIHEGVYIVLSNWDVLQRVLDEGIVQRNNSVIKESDGKTSGKNEALQSDETVINAFTKELANYIYDYDVDEGYIGDFITEYVSKNFFLDLDETRDVDFIAKTLNDLNYTISREDDSVYKKLQEYDGIAKKNKPKFDKKIDSDDEDGDYSDEDDGDQGEKLEEVKEEETHETQQKEQSTEDSKQIKETEQQQQQPLVDEDGFVTVVSRRKKK